MIPLYKICPVCDSGWGHEEIKDQECNFCGYPENTPIEEVEIIFVEENPDTL